MTAAEFIEAFIQQKSAIFADANLRLEALFMKCFGEPLLQRTDNFLLRDRQEVKEVEESGTSAKVITCAKFPSGKLRHRYHLSQLDGEWKIFRLDYMCFMCRGTGKRGDSPCKECGGEGWCETADREKHQNE